MEKLPLLIWAYPTEYKDKNSAGQSLANPNQFTFPHYGSFVYWVTKGYAVLDNAAFPIIGEGETEPNDNFISQLTMRKLQSMQWIRWVTSTAKKWLSADILMAHL